MENILFKELGLSKNILRGLDKMGFAETTPVQGKAIPPLLQGRDVTVQAPTGTGKTCAFGVPVIESVDTGSRGIQALILCPTRELTVQTSTVLQKLAQFNPSVKIAAIYGGERIEKQFASLRRNPQIVVATPGRMMDHLRRGSIKISALKIVVLDEADRMLDMGFRDDLNTILETVPAERQTALFSATLSVEIKQIAKTYQKDAVPIQIRQEALTVDSVEQFYTEIRGKTKTPALINLLREKQFYLSLVFVGTKSMADELAGKLSQGGFKAEALHGDLRQRQRDLAMNKFRRGQTEVLVATDVAARGIDVTNIDAVINYDIPQEADSYVHRIGRTGRADKTGVAYTFIYPKERQKLREIMSLTKTTILPASIDISKTQLEFEKPVITTKEKPAPSRRAEMETAKNSSTARMFISLGTKDNLTPKKMLALISTHSDILVKQIGQISIYEKFSFFEVPQKYAKQVIADLCGVLHNQRTVTVEVSGGVDSLSANPAFRKKRGSGGRHGAGKSAFMPRTLAAGR